MARQGLEDAQRAHISDLRVLVDQAHERERELAGMVRMVMEERFYRPTITRDAGKRGEGSRLTPAVMPEAMQDIAHFDEAADAAQVKQESDLEREARATFHEVMREENQFRAQRGAPPVETVAS